MTPDDPRYITLLVQLWRHNWKRRIWVAEWYCRECFASGPVKHEVMHAVGCALFGQDRDLLAQIDAFEIAEGEVV